MELYGFYINGATLNVVARYDRIACTLDDIRNAWDDESYTVAYTVESGNVKREDYFADVDMMTNLITRIQTNQSILREYVEQIRRKKNGKFWSNSGVTIAHMENVCNYFTDYTNAWNYYHLRLEVVNEDTCELVLRTKTVTN